MSDEEINEIPRDRFMERESILRAKLKDALLERDEARREMDEARKALMWIAGRYCYEKTTAELAQDAYEMFSMARWTLQELEKNEEAK